ncbi:hypothetical protein [Arthrobacter sp. 31Cvi3.1E]|uniref:hypothetical protein n=1 Tax=Paenarthrobacter nicotinovorans TaxID=29320 RepID=UPI0011814620
MAPVLQSYDLPCIMACTVDMVAASVGAAQIHSWHVNDGFQVVNHSYSYGPASTDAQLVHEIIESADAHETNMPAVKIHAWTMPGTGTGTPYGGYDDSTESALWNTTAGKLLMSRHGIVMGSRGGWLAPQGGAVDGQGHTTFESSSVAQFQTVVESAKKAGPMSGFDGSPRRPGHERQNVLDGLCDVHGMAGVRAERRQSYRWHSLGGPCVEPDNDLSA